MLSETRAMLPDPLIAQYEDWIYPQPIPDLDSYAAKGGHDLSDPSRMRRKLWPRAVEPSTLNILVAGCGANQAAIIAHANPQHRVVGIDLSAQALAHHERLKKRHGLSNLELQQIAVENASELGQQFDYIVSTGVLHHLPNPAAGLSSLRGVLAPHGVISVMLYGYCRRFGLYMVQEAMRSLDVERDPAGVAFARETVGNLPAWHHARSYLDQAPDLGYDAGFVDTVLNVRDRAYTVPDIMDLVTGAGLRFQSWLDGIYYSPAAVFPAEAQIHDRIYQLPLVSQWHVVDLLAQIAGAHRFLVCHPDRKYEDLKPDFSDAPQTGAWLDCVPHRHPDLRVTHGLAGSGKFEREWHRFNLDGKTFAVFNQIDGHRTFRDLMADMSDVGEREHVSAVFAQMIEWDHLFCQLPTQGV